MLQFINRKAIAAKDNVLVKTSIKTNKAGTEYTAIEDVAHEIDLGVGASENNFADYSEITQTQYEALKATQETAENA